MIFTFAKNTDLKIYQWHQLEQKLLAGIPDRQITGITIAGKAISILMHNGNIYAFASLCPHAGAPLCDGWVDAMGRVVCPMHKYRFDPANGRNTSGEGYKLYTYPVENRNGEFFVGLPETNF